MPSIYYTQTAVDSAVQIWCQGLPNALRLGMRFALPKRAGYRVRPIGKRANANYRPRSTWGKRRERERPNPLLFRRDLLSHKKTE